MELTHFNEAGRARMVDVSEKAATDRAATATGFITMRPETLALVQRGGMKKGDVLAVAQVARPRSTPPASSPCATRSC